MQVDGLFLTDGEITQIYEELATLHVELDDDPLLYGPKRLNGKIAQTRKMLTRCEQIFLELSRRLHGCQREHRKHTALLDMSKQDLLANDPEVRSGRNIADRDAIAAIKLRPQIELTQKLETATTDIETILTVVKAKRADIKDLQNRLKDQIKVCQDEIGLGSRWGSANPPQETSPTLVAGQHSQAPKVGSDDQLSEIFAAIDLELEKTAPSSLVEDEDEGVVEKAVSHKILAPTATQSDADLALDGLDTEIGQSDFNLDSILG